MKVLFIRHAVAEKRENFARTGMSDDHRPLTPEGRRKMRRALRGLKIIAPRIDVLGTSPLARAVETAALIARGYEDVKREEVAELSPKSKPAGLLKWLQKQKENHVVTLVGHEPHLSTFVCWMLHGARDSFVELKKGSAVLVDFPGEIEAGAGTLVWALTSRQLRRLG